MQIRIRTALLLTLLLPLAACFEGIARQRDAHEWISAGHSRVNGGDPEGGLDCFDAALRQMDSDDRALRLYAEVSRCEALAYIDAEHSEEEFLRLTELQNLSVANYSRVIRALKDEAHYPQALTLLGLGQAKFPDETRFSALAEEVSAMADAAAAAGDPEAAAMMEQLKSLGYVGNDDRKR